MKTVIRIILALIALVALYCAIFTKGESVAAGRVSGNHEPGI